MDTNRFLVTGCGRSGTTYAASLLTELGAACGHEQVFRPQEILRGEVVWPDDVPGEASWMGAPFVQGLPEGTVVLHQVREPLAVVRSFLRMRFFEDPSDYPEYLAVARAVLPELGAGAPLERALRYWLGWNRLAERAAQTRGLRYLRYRVEDLDLELVAELAAELGHAVPPGQIERALARQPRDLNTRGDRTADPRTWEELALQGTAAELAPQVRALAEQYGYGAQPLERVARRGADGRDRPRSIAAEIAGRAVRIEYPAAHGIAPHVGAVLVGREYPLVYPGLYAPRTIIDVGAHAGAASVFFAAHHPAARVFAFEPCALTFGFLQRNVAAFDNVTPIRCALGAADAEAPLFAGRHSSMQSSLKPGAETGTEFELVPVRRAADALAELGCGAPSMLKIDSEGCELEILTSLRALLPEIDVIHLEYHAANDRCAIEDLLAPHFALYAARSAEPGRGTCTWVAHRVGARCAA